MKSFRLFAWLIGLLPALLQAQSSAQGLDVAAERERLSRERAAAEQAYAREERACYQQFVVTSCLDAAKLRRREALAEIKRQEGVINNAERVERGSKAQQRIDETQSPEKAAQRERERQQRVEQAERSRAQAARADDKRFEQAARTGDARDATAQKGLQASEKAAKRQAVAAESAAKRTAYDEKLANAERRRADAAKQQTERKKPRADGLPVPEAGNSPASGAKPATPTAVLSPAARP